VGSEENPEKKKRCFKAGEGMQWKTRREVREKKVKVEVKVRAVEFKILQNRKHTNISSLTTIVQNF
jgi:hypothetical protein